MRINKCRVCATKKLKVILNLGDQPWGNNFVSYKNIKKVKKYPLILVFCEFCKTPQINYTIPKEEMFFNHTYLSGVTKSLSEHFFKLASYNTNKFFKKRKKKIILDLGSNDGAQLKQNKKLKWEVLGVESSKKIAEIANKQRLKTLPMFFNLKNAKKINKKFDLINASGVFFHLEELHSFTEAVNFLLKDNGIFCVQFLYMKSICENIAFDQIYHEHLLFYNLKNLNYLLNLHQLEIFHAKLTEIHGGQMVAYICKKGQRNKTFELNNYFKIEQESKCNTINFYKKFASKVKKLKKKNVKNLKLLRKRKKVIYGMGAPVKGNTLLNYFKINNKIIKYLVEKNELRKNLYSPGSNIKILIEKELSVLPDVYYVLAWNFKKEILKNNKHLLKKGVKFIFPINPK